MDNLYLDRWLESLVKTKEIMLCAVTDSLSAHPSHRIPPKEAKALGDAASVSIQNSFCVTFT